MQKAVLPETGFIRIGIFLELFPISKSSLYDGIKKGKYPAPVKLSKRTSAWRVEDVRELIQKVGEYEVVCC